MHSCLTAELVKQATPYSLDDRKVLGATILTRNEVKVVNGDLGQGWLTLDVLNEALALPVAQESIARKG